MLAIAHRAPRDPARAAALAAAGAAMFELDVQLRGGEVVVSHWLPMPHPLPVERDNWRVRPRGRPDVALVDALATLPRDVHVLLDPKHHRGFEPVALAEAVGELLPSLGGPERFVVSTGTPAALAAYRALGLRTWHSIGDAAALARAVEHGPLPGEGVSVRHTLVDPESLRALRGVTGIISAWTVNRLPRARHLVRLGVDAVTSDSSTVLAWVAHARVPRADR